MKKAVESWKDLGTARSDGRPGRGPVEPLLGWYQLVGLQAGHLAAPKSRCLKLCFYLSPLQMFIMEKVEGAQCSLHEFSITGSTYAPEGQM